MDIDELGDQELRVLFSQLATHSPNVLWVFSADWSELVFVNDHYEDVWGRSIDALQADPSDFLNGIHPDDRDAVRTAMAALTAGEARDIEYRVNEAKSYEQWVHVHGRPIRNDEGDVVRVAGFCRDITTERRQQAELERQNDRLESFASVVSHDLRNPLNVASGHLALAREECESEHLDPVERAHDRMDALIDRLLALARSGATPSMEPVDLEAVARTCWQGVETGGATLDVEVSGYVEADEVRVKQIFENLYRNAIEHGGADVTVTVGALDTGDGFYVADDGPGIRPEYRPRVFQPGFTTTETGTGLGLAIVSEVATAYDWSIGVAESDSGGARFEFRGVEFVDEPTESPT